MNELAHKQSPDDGLRELALFAGAGGGILGGKLLGWRTVCAVEWEPYPASVLMQRQNDGILAPFPIWDDVRTFDGRPWRGCVDVVSGGFPCQDISAAGKGAGIDGARSGMWAHMARIIGEVRPRYVFVENSPMLTSRGLGRVLGDLAALGYDARWCVLGANDAGAPHKRDRIWIAAHAPRVPRDERRTESARQLGPSRLANGRNDVADSNSLRQLQPQGGERNERGRAGYSGIAVPDAIGKPLRDAAGGDMESLQSIGAVARCDGSAFNVADAHKIGLQGKWPNDDSLGREKAGRPPRLCDGAQFRRVSNWWETEPDVGRAANGVAARVDRLKAIGNGQVPAVAALAWEMLKP